MTLLQAASAITLWRSGEFNTLDIATALGIHEALIVKILDEVRNRERGPFLSVVQGGL